MAFRKSHSLNRVRYLKLKNFIYMVLSKLKPLILTYVLLTMNKWLIKLASIYNLKKAKKITHEGYFLSTCGLTIIRID
jgi:hypothetical protein